MFGGQQAQLNQTRRRPGRPSRSDPRGAAAGSRRRTGRRRWRSRRRSRCRARAPCGRRTSRRRWRAAAASSSGSWRSPRRSRCTRGRAAARTGHRTLVLVPRAVPAGQVRLGGDHVGPAADRRGEQLVVAGLGGDVGDACLEVERADHVPDLGVRLQHRHVVLQVAVAHAGVARPGRGRAGRRTAGPGRGRRRARLPVELGEGGLDDRVPVEALLVAGELADQVIGERTAMASGAASPAPRRSAIAAWMRWPAQYISWLDASLV